jgi:glycosyltransferase involved in cell wall biosynthesis
MAKPQFGQTRKMFQKVVRKVRSIANGLQRTEKDFWVYSPFSMPVQHNKWLKVINEKIIGLQVRHVMRKLEMNAPMVWVVCPTACDVALGIKRTKLIYQRTDCFEAFPGADRLVVEAFDRKLKAVSDMTVYVNHSLYEKEKHQCRNAFFLDQGVSYDMFANTDQDLGLPEELRDIPRPIAGFIGSLDDCNPDIEFLAGVSKLLPEISFVVVGKAQCDCSVLLSQKNIHMIGQKPYERMPEFGRCFDVAILPLKQSRWTDAVNPLKLKEYLAMGKPVVATPFPELEHYLDVVSQAATTSEFAQCIREAIRKDHADLVAKRREKVNNSSWDNKAEVVIERIWHSSERRFS